jgi:hypothetical protein
MVDDGYGKTLVLRNAKDRGKKNRKDLINPNISG